MTIFWLNLKNWPYSNFGRVGIFLAIRIVYAYGVRIRNPKTLRNGIINQLYVMNIIKSDMMA